ncbi:hypothetical protein HRM2_25490 [Desulforapulum autotrophicum HRM2]|uniref:Uncharacterized protein n=1 Tax=Desulforapulum autotrophicum (strain ATCC 43914 / DSM 3382 / VKM B-1955 / HRM2) TaxID=177437 RepID=C0QGZ4_DESAH|nr:hypothetical protein [Desulforapulum autotrophicum]ACN15643.1 hypothetical protein HRM2_25490 [Desulforapulum autotrophicum HRM2]
MNIQTYSRYYSAAGITFKIISEFPFTENTFHPKFRLFEIEGADNEDVLLYHHFKKFDESVLNEKHLIFSNEYLEVYIDDNNFFYKQKTSQKYNIRYDAVAVFNKQHSLGHVYVEDINSSAYACAALDSLVFFGGDHYLFSNLLSNRNGILVHGNSLSYNNQGVLLIGRSGAGKSTLSGILKSDNFDMIGDDRTIIKVNDNQYYLFGSWCHGSLPVVSNKKFFFNKLFILEQSPENTIIPISSNHEKLKKIMQSIVKPFAKGPQWEKIFNLVDGVISNIDFYQLKFNLDGDISQLIKGYYERD